MPLQLLTAAPSLLESLWERIHQLIASAPPLLESFWARVLQLAAAAPLLLKPFWGRIVHLVATPAPHWPGVALLPTPWSPAGLDASWLVLGLIGWTAVNLLWTLLNLRATSARASTPQRAVPLPAPGVGAPAAAAAPAPAPVAGADADADADDAAVPAAGIAGPLSTAWATSEATPLLVRQAAAPWLEQMSSADPAKAASAAANFAANVFADLYAACSHDTLRAATLLARDAAYAPTMDWACRALSADAVSSSFAPGAAANPGAARAALAAAVVALRRVERARYLLPAACARRGVHARRDDGSVDSRILAGRISSDAKREVFLEALEGAIPGYGQWGAPFGHKYVCCAALAAALKLERAAAAAAVPAVA